jgi:hypothetical protein
MWRSIITEPTRRRGSRRCPAVQWRFGCERCPPSRAACRRILRLTPRQYGGPDAWRRPSWAATLTVRRSGVSRDGLDGVPNERTTRQTVWEPYRPSRWRRLSAALARSTKQAGVLLARPRAKNNRDIVQVSPMPHAHTLLRFSLNVGRATSYKSSMSRSGYLLRRGGAGRSGTETGGPAGVLAGVLLAREQGA